MPLFWERLGLVEQNKMTAGKNLIAIIGKDEYQMCIDLGRRIINCLYKKKCP